MHGIVLCSHYNTEQKHYHKERGKTMRKQLNEAMQKFFGVLDKYARVCDLSLGR